MLNYMQKEIVSQAHLVIFDDFTRSLSILGSTAKYALNKIQNMLKIIHDTIFFIRS